MKPSIRKAILSFTGSSDFEQETQIQSLWSGYGQILRLRCQGLDDPVVIKYVSLPDAANHPRGWNTDISHQRKIRSYQVESHWYQNFASRCDDLCRVPACLGTLEDDQEFVMVLEDLDAAGFADRVDSVDSVDGVNEQEIFLCVQWLANFHALFLGEGGPDNSSTDIETTGLWPIGTYWHLDTRPDEWAALPEGDLKRYAAAIDQRLNACRWQTLVHGDTKLANFCFAENRQSVAAVDFQYVGGGCGMKDLVYFISSCLSEDDCERYESVILDRYYIELKLALNRLNKPLSDDEFEALETEWRSMYPVAWADFYRFLQGWSPGHWKIHGYSQNIADAVMARMKKSEKSEPQVPELDLQELLATAISAAKAAGELIESYRDKDLDVTHKGLGGSLSGEVVTDVDLRCQTLIESRLKPLSERYAIAFIGEESADHTARFDGDYSWLVDPIDGTLAFIEKREGYSVSIGLIDQEGEPLLGVVFDPFNQRLYSAANDCGKLCQTVVANVEVPGADIDVSHTHKGMLICYLDQSYKNDSRYDSVLQHLSSQAKDNGFAGIQVVAQYGAALNACSVLESHLNGQSAVYFKLPKEKGGSIWDYAASAAIFKASNRPVSDLDGKPLDLNRKDSTYLNHKGFVFASDVVLYQWVLNVCGQLL
jgi:3'-phosphoadenosine 5'-phosphosulfate (PAPS) 3'-phosphatase